MSERSVKSFKKRARIAGKSANMIGTAAFREGHSSTPLPLNGKTVFGTIINYARGNVTPLEAMEESVETRSDMWIQLRALEIDGRSENPSTEAQKQALAELADVVRRARAELMQLEPGLQISEVPENAQYMDVIEAMSDMGRARLIASSLMPSWMHEVQDMVSSALDETAEAIRIAEAAKRASTEDAPGWRQLEEIFASFDVPMGNVYSSARIDAAVIEQVRLARARVRGVAVATTAAEAQARQAEDVARDEALEREEEAAASVPPEQPKAEVGKPAEEQTADMLANTPEAKAPTGMKGVFLRDACVYNEAGGFYVGCVPVRNLRDSKEIEQVKAGAKGKHGVVNPITGEYQQETEAIYVWRRKDGTLEVISGRHKFALALENGTESVICYVFNEDAQHDAKWARLLDFENNMRGDQADELTAAIYTRETGYDDATLRKKGLMRNKSKSKRGILIGREARQELWDRFINGAVSPMDAEIICQMTLGIRDKARVDEIQRRCCMLLEQGKSWEYISAMVQLMANKESVFMRQGLLDLGADFEADMERAAAYVEKCVSQLNETIGIIKSGRKLSGEKRKKAERVNVYTSSAETSEAMLNDLITMREMFRNIGAYPDLVAAASMWDGKTELDAVGMALSRAKGELEQAAAEAGMTREEWEEAQAAKAAKQAAEEGAGLLFGGSMSGSLRTAPPPKKTGIGYKVFYRGKDGKLYPPMVANPGGQDTPVGVWLDADEGTRAGESKTGRPQVKAGGKGTQGGSGTLAYRPGWHLGEIPYAVQFNRKDPVTGEKSLFPADFVWAEVEYAMDEDYQEEAMSYGYTENGKFRHSYAGLPRLPKDGFYKYRTNPNPATDPWIITGAMKVNRVLSQQEVDELVRAAGREPQQVERGLFGSYSTREVKPEAPIAPHAIMERADGSRYVRADDPVRGTNWAKAILNRKVEEMTYIDAKGISFNGVIYTYKSRIGYFLPFFLE